MDSVPRPPSSYDDYFLLLTDCGRHLDDIVPCMSHKSVAETGGNIVSVM